MNALSLACIVLSCAVHLLAWGMLRTCKNPEPELAHQVAVLLDAFAESSAAPATEVTEVTAKPPVKAVEPSSPSVDPAPVEVAPAAEPAPPEPAPTVVPMPAQGESESEPSTAVSAWRAPSAEAAATSPPATPTPATAPAAEPRQFETVTPTPTVADGPAQAVDAPQPADSAMAGPATAAEATASPTPPAAGAPTPLNTPAWQPTGPPVGLRLPRAIQRGTPSADLVIDPRDAAFLQRATALGMTFLVFQDGTLDFFLELQGNTLRQAVRRTAVDTTRYSRRARDLAGVRSFDQLRNEVAERYGLDPQRCRLAALVPIAVDRAFVAEEQAALAALGLPASELIALCGTLTEDPVRPLEIRHALTARGQWLGVTR
jgi:hypothetical protein